MSRTMILVLAAVAALALAAPAQAADVVAKLLAPSVRTLAPAGDARCAATTYRSSVTGMLDVRLRGSGDWDLVVRDANGNRVASSRGLRRQRGRPGLGARRAQRSSPRPAAAPAPGRGRG